MVFGTFLLIFFEVKIISEPLKQFIKSVTKHWPWRENQGSALQNFINKSLKIVENNKFFSASIREAFWIDFGRVLGVENPRFSQLFQRYFEPNFEARFW